MRDEKKYEILPGVELPDFKTIKAAASDFSISDVGEVDVFELDLARLKLRIRHVKNAVCCSRDFSRKQKSVRQRKKQLLMFKTISLN